eukprot:362749-Chlamydomonas_euryale.AAC.11
MLPALQKIADQLLRKILIDTCICHTPCGNAIAEVLQTSKFAYHRSHESADGIILQPVILTARRPTKWAWSLPPALQDIPGRCDVCPG